MYRIVPHFFFSDEASGITSEASCDVISPLIKVRRHEIKMVGCCGIEAKSYGYITFDVKRVGDTIRLFITTTSVCNINDVKIDGNF